MEWDATSEPSGLQGIVSPLSTPEGPHAGTHGPQWGFWGGSGAVPCRPLPSPCPRTCAVWTGADDSQLRIWDTSGRCTKVCQGHARGVQALVFQEAAGPCTLHQPVWRWEVGLCRSVGMG